MVFDVSGPRLQRIEGFLRYRVSVNGIEVGLESRFQSLLISRIHVAEVREVERDVLSSNGKREALLLEDDLRSGIDTDEIVPDIFRIGLYLVFDDLLVSQRNSYDSLLIHSLVSSGTEHRRMLGLDVGNISVDGT